MKVGFVDLNGVTYPLVECWQRRISTFRAYVDSDLCARLMLGPITTSRIECSKSTFKDGSMPVLVRLPNNMVFTPNKEKMLRPWSVNWPRSRARPNRRTAR